MADEDPDISGYGRRQCAVDPERVGVGGVVGITTTSKPKPFGLLVVNVYIEFDRPGEDHMIAVSRTPNAPRNISVVGGTFDQHRFGNDNAPGAALVAAFPSLAFDSFVSIGVKMVGAGGQPVDATLPTPTWPGFGPSTLTMTTEGWAITPSNVQGNPFDAVNSYAGNGQILIGQFSTSDGVAIQGTMMLKYIGNSTAQQSIVSFFHVPMPGALAMMGMMGVAAIRHTAAPMAPSGSLTSSNCRWQCMIKGGSS